MNSDLLPQLQSALGDDYRFEKELGGGGMSRVYIALELGLGRRVVVKVLPPELGAGVNVDRFRRETQLAASLQHPHIVPLLTAGAAGDLLYYTMPFIEGESLHARLARERELPVRDTLRILRDVADALAYAHGRGVVHRDIKPDNVLLSGGHALVFVVFGGVALGHVMRGGLRLIAIGVVGGSVIAALLAQRAASLLFKEPPLDPVVYAGVAGVLFLVAVLATWLPASAAARVDPSVTLRSD